MMKTESFNWQRPAKICNGVKDFGLLREKLTNADESKRRDFSSIYISRLVFIVGAIAVITFVMCLVLADKYQKSVSLSHHYASFVFEKSQDERLYAVRSGRGDDDDDDDRKGGTVHKSVFNAAGFVKLENISNKLPIEEINLLLPATTVLHSLNVSRNGRKYSSPPSPSHNSARWTSAAADTIAKTVTAVKKKNNIQSLADLLRRTELKTVITDRGGSGGGSAYANATTTTTTTATATAPAPAPNHATDTRTTAAIETEYGARGSGAVSTTSTQTSIHFAQLESYPRRTRNNNLQHLIKYINCESSADCWLKRQQDAETSLATAASDPRQTQTFATLQPQHDVRIDTSDAKDSDSAGYSHSDSNSDSDSDNDDNDDEKQRMQVQKTEQRSPWSTDEEEVNSIAYADKSNYDDDDDDDEKDDIMFTADTRAAPRYYSPPPPPPPYLTMNRNRVNSDPFRNYRASSPVEINRLQLHDQTESASVTASEHQMLQHRFSNRMYHNQGGGDNLEAYAYDLDPYLKPPTPPPPTLLSFTPSYATTTIFHPFNDPSLMAGAGAAPPAHFENDLRSEATAVEPILSQIKPISLMVEIFPANEYELPGSVLGAGGGTGGVTTATSNDNHMAAAVHAAAVQQREQTLENGGATSNQANAPSLAASLMSWKLAPFSQNKMRLLVNLFPQHQHTPASG